MSNKQAISSGTSFAEYVTLLLIALLTSQSMLSSALALDKNDPTAAQSAFKSGKALYDQKKFPEAQKFFTRAAMAGSNSSVYQYYLGLAAAQNGDIRSVKRAMARILIRNAPFTNNAIQAGAMMKRYVNGCEPYLCTNGATQTVRFLKRDMPIKIFVTNGLMLPAPYRGKDGFSVGEMRGVVDLLRRGDAYVGRLEHDPSFKSTHKQDVIRGIQRWDWACSEGLFTYQLVNSANDCDIIVFWCPEMIGGNGGYTSSGNYPDIGKKVVMQIATNTSRPDDTKYVSDYTTWLATHEFGHCWGLCSHSPNARDIMHATPAPPDAVPGAISENDKTTLRALYEIAPDIGM